MTHVAVDLGLGRREGLVGRLEEVKEACINKNQPVLLWFCRVWTLFSEASFSLKTKPTFSGTAAFMEAKSADGDSLNESDQVFSTGKSLLMRC